MPTKSAEVTMVLRDGETGDPVGTQSTMGQTEDDGVTVTMGLGNLPGIENCGPGDLSVAVSTINILAPEGASVVVDTENEVQVITFEYP